MDFVKGKSFPKSKFVLKNVYKKSNPFIRVYMLLGCLWGLWTTFYN